jgi:hypothetical protein
MSRHSECLFCFPNPQVARFRRRAALLGTAAAKQHVCWWFWGSVSGQVLLAGGATVVVVCVATSLGYTQGRGPVLCVKGAARMARFGGIINGDLEQIKQKTVLFHTFCWATLSSSMEQRRETVEMPWTAPHLNPLRIWV